MGWLPRAQKVAAAGPLRPWRPRSLRSVDFSGYRYAVVDELEAGWAVIGVCDWPVVDEQGRLHFPLEEPVTVTAEVAALQGLLAARRLPETLRARELRHGDAFAVQTSDERLARAAGEQPVDPADWIGDTVYDVTRDARREAKVAFYSAVTEPLPFEQAVEVLRTAGEETVDGGS